MEKRLEFVENREPRGCFGADVEALTGIDQDDVNGALEAAELYNPEMGVRIASDIDYSEAMKNAGLKIRFAEVLPYYDPFNGDEEPLDDSEEVVSLRLDILRKEVRKDDHEGALIAFPCQRYKDDEPFLHFVAAVAPQEEGSELTIMDPSELRHRVTNERIGGVFHKGEEEVREMLTPRSDLFLPVCAWLVQVDELPKYISSPVAEAETNPPNELHRVLETSDVSGPFIL